MTTNGMFKILLLTLVAVSFSFNAWSVSDGSDTPATIVWYMEQEAGIEPYRVRYIVTPEFMRSDEGRDDGAFTLFDRKQEKIYSVVPENRTVLSVDGSGDKPKVPEQLSFEVQAAVDDQAPRVGGEAPLRVDLVTGGTVCHSALVSTGILAPVQVALQSFMRSLAVQQVRTLANTPAEYQTPCFLLRYVYASDFHWARGVVLVDWNAQGDRRELIDYQADVAVPKALFVVPEDYLMLPTSVQ